MLKANGRSAFAHTVFPGSEEAFTLMFLGSIAQNTLSTEGVFLVSAIDLIPNQPLPLARGSWELLYQFSAIGFPVLWVEVSLKYRTFESATAQILSQYC
jgi:hypothetical protein